MCRKWITSPQSWQVKVDIGGTEEANGRVDVIVEDGFVWDMFGSDIDDVVVVGWCRHVCEEKMVSFEYDVQILVSFMIGR